MSKSWYISNRSFQTAEGENKSKILWLSCKKGVYLQPDIIEYDKCKIKPEFNLILGSKTMKELGTVLDFWTYKITLDEISLPLRDINKLKKAQIEKSWTVRNSIYQDMPKSLRAQLRPPSTSYKSLTPNMKWWISGQLWNMIASIWVLQLNHCYWSSYKTLRSCLMRH